jgi:hypothetical protein
VSQWLAKSRRQFSDIHEKIKGMIVITADAVAVQVNIGDFVAFFQRFVSSFNKILDQELASNTFSPMEETKLKIDVSVCCSSLQEIIQALCVFPEEVSQLKTSILELNSNLGELYKYLNLPFAVVLTVEEMIRRTELIDDDDMAP